jgi:hypothetical protein
MNRDEDSLSHFRELAQEVYRVVCSLAIETRVGSSRKIKIPGLATSSTPIVRPDKLPVSVSTLFDGFRLTLALFDTKTGTRVTDEGVLEIFQL